MSFANSPLAPRGLAVAGDFLFAEDSSGAWATHYVYSSAGALLSSKEWNYYSTEYIWNATNRKMYFFRDDTSPNDVIWEDIDLEGQLGTETDSPYHGDYTIKHLLRVSPDGTKVILGNGDLYAGVTLQRLGSLSRTLVDAVWVNGSLFTLSTGAAVGGSAATSGTLESWGTSTQVDGSLAITSTPLRMFPLTDGLVVITQNSHGIQFTRVGLDLRQVSSDPPILLTPPAVVTGDATQVSSSSAYLGGTVNPHGLATTAYLEYGPTQSYGSKTSSVTVPTGSSDQPVVQTVSGLAANSTYYFRVVASNGDGVSYGESKSFKTTAAKPSLFSTAVSSVTNTGAHVTGYATPNGSDTSVYVEYGTTPSFGQTTASVGIGAGSASVAIDLTLSALAPATTYYYHVAAANAGGITYGFSSSFTTTGRSVTPVTTGAATAVDTGSATILGSVNPDGSDTYVRFQMGIQSATEFSTAEYPIGNGTTAVPVQVSVTGLAAGTTYHYQVVARNATGTRLGLVRDFTTTALALTAVDDNFLLTGTQKRTIDVLANDLGAPRSGLTIIAVGPDVGGKVSINRDNTLSYQPSSTPIPVDTFTYQVSDSAGHTASATVTVRSSLGGAEGSYHGLVGAADSAFEKAGSLQVAFSAKGHFTGTLRLGGIHLPFLGALLPYSTDQVSLGSVDGTLVVKLILDVEADELTGTVLRSGELLPFAAARVTADLARHTPLAGRYTLLAGSPTAPAVAGAAFATVLVGPSGGAHLIGRGSDGTPFTAAASIGADGRFPFYALPGAQRKANLHGWVAFRAISNISDFDGAIGWSTASTALSSSTTRLLSLVGSRYVAPVGKALPLPFSATAGNSLLKFGEGDNSLVAPITSTLAPAHLRAPGSSVSKVKLDLATGQFSGVLTLSGSPCHFYGVFFQRQAMGGGVVMATDGPGWVSLVRNAP